VNVVTCIPAATLASFKDVILIGCALTGAYVALKGLATWKEKLNWSHISELKRNILVELYRLENAIENLRTPKLTTTTYDSKSTETLTAQRYNSYANRYSEDWNEVMSHRNILRSYMPEVRATWDSKLIELIDELEPHLKKLHWAIHDQLEVRNVNTDKDTKNDLNKGRKQRSKIIFKQRSNDSFKEDIEKIISSVEEYLENKNK